MIDISLSDFITGEKFESICDIDCEKNILWKTAIQISSQETLKVFCQTHELKNVVPFISQIKNKKFILISHNSDGVICHINPRPFYRQQYSYPIDYACNDVPENIIHWFAQNFDVSNDKITPIPLGVENSYVFKPEIKQQRMLNLMNTWRTKQNSLFICFNRGTNPPYREEPYVLFKNKSWAICQEGFNNVTLIESYFNEMIKHKFILCPDGNGLDTHRTWEALYLGCIPIVQRHVFTEWFSKKLPIIIIDNYDVITEEWLLKQLEELNKRTFDYSILTMKYWINEINNRRFCD